MAESNTTDDVRSGESTSGHVVSKRFDDLTTGELHDILRLRCDVFVVEQACIYADVDGRDDEPATTHHWISGGDGISVYLRVLGEADGSSRIGRVVTTGEARGDGLAARLVTVVTSALDGEVVLDAQSHLVAWYERLEFEPCGDEFVEDGIPHVPMRRRR